MVGAHLDHFWRVQDIFKIKTKVSVSLITHRQHLISQMPGFLQRILFFTSQRRKNAILIFFSSTIQRSFYKPKSIFKTKRSIPFLSRSFVWSTNQLERRDFFFKPSVFLLWHKWGPSPAETIRAAPGLYISSLKIHSPLDLELDFEPENCGLPSPILQNLLLYNSFS